MRFVVLKTPWWECIAAGVPFLSAPGDTLVVMDPREYLGPNTDRGTPDTDVIMNPHREPMLAARVWAKFPEHVILYETENLIGAARWRMASELIRQKCPRNVWWNYSATNAQVFGDVPRTLRIPLGQRQPASPGRDLDVVFVGSLNERRARVIGQLERSGLRVAMTTGPIFGAALAQLEARARVVLNVHYYQPGVFESFRVVPAAARGSVVVSEASEGGEGWEFCAASVHYSQLVDVVRERVELMRKAET